MWHLLQGTRPSLNESDVEDPHDADWPVLHVSLMLPCRFGGILIGETS